MFDQDLQRHKQWHILIIIELNDIQFHLHLGIHHVAKSEEEEANWIANKIEDIVNNQDGVNYRDIAILYRANYLSRTIEQVLIRKGIDYRIFGGLKFFQKLDLRLSFVLTLHSERMLSWTQHFWILLQALILTVLTLSHKNSELLG